MSLNRREPLTNAETVRLGRRLHELFGVDHVSYPNGTPTVVGEVWDYRGSLPTEATASLEAVIKTFDVSSLDG